MSSHSLGHELDDDQPKLGRVFFMFLIFVDVSRSITNGMQVILAASPGCNLEYSRN